jgi:hypothetical protein
MRRWAFVFSIVGIFLLIMFVGLGNVTEIDNLEDLKGLIDNEKVIVSGKVENEKINSWEKVMVLNNGIKLVCELNCGYYVGNKVRVLGIVESWTGEKRVRVLEIKT